MPSFCAVFGICSIIDKDRKDLKVIEQVVLYISAHTIADHTGGKCLSIHMMWQIRCETPIEKEGVLYGEQITFLQHVDQGS